MSPIPICFLEPNHTFRQLAVEALRYAFSAEITLLSAGDTWPLPVCPSVLPEAVLLGLGAEGLVNAPLLAAIQAALPGVPVIVLGHLDDAAYRVAALAAGATAFVSKDALSSELVPALRRHTRHQREQP